MYVCLLAVLTLMKGQRLCITWTPNVTPLFFWYRYEVLCNTRSRQFQMVLFDVVEIDFCYWISVRTHTQLFFLKKSWSWMLIQDFLAFMKNALRFMMHKIDLLKESKVYHHSPLLMIDPKRKRCKKDKKGNGCNKLLSSLHWKKEGKVIYSICKIKLSCERRCCEKKKIILKKKNPLCQKLGMKLKSCAVSVVFTKLFVAVTFWWNMYHYI